VKAIRWDRRKNALLKRQRGVSFEEVELAIERGNLLDVLEHPKKNRYPNQRIFVVRIMDYAYLVPFVESEEEIFLKTIIPNREATNRYLSEDI